MESHESMPVPRQEMGHRQPQERPQNEGEPVLAEQKGGVRREHIEVKTGLASELPFPIVATQPTVQLPAPLSSGPSVAAQGTLSSASPLSAADEDLIEQEWVKKAKTIIEQTKTDPRLQESEISKLQADYLKKRYGKEVPLTTSS